LLIAASLGRGGLAQVVELRDHRLDLDPCRCDAGPAHADELRGPLHLAGQDIDIDVGPLELLEDLLELGDRLAVADRLVAHGTTSLSMDPAASVVTTLLPTCTSAAARTTAPVPSRVTE